MRRFALFPCSATAVQREHLSLADVVHRPRAKRQPDVLHLAGLQQVVAVAAFLLQLGLDGCHLLLQLGQLPARRTEHL